MPLFDAYTINNTGLVNAVVQKRNNPKDLKEKK
jgi:hypothetical protein